MRAIRIPLPPQLKKKFDKRVSKYGGSRDLATDSGVSIHIINQVKYSGKATQGVIDMIGAVV